jgi:hypothetical protein
MTSDCMDDQSMSFKASSSGAPQSEACRPELPAVEVVAAYAKHGAKAVGEMFGIHRQTVINIVRKHGGKIRSRWVNVRYCGGQA